MLYNTDRYEELFDDYTKNKETAAMETGVESYRKKEIYAGDMLFVDCYPIWNTEIETRKAKAAINNNDEYDVMRKRWLNHNERVSRKNFIAKVCANFTAGDLCVTLTYDPKKGRTDLEQAKTDIKNYIRRVRNWRKKNGLPPMKYIYRLEFLYEDNDFSRPAKNIHFHVFMSSMDRDAAERLWHDYNPRGGQATNADRIKFNADGMLGLAKYTTKQANHTDIDGMRTWACSKNCVEPVRKFPKHRLTRRKAANLCRDMEAARIEFEKQYPKYRLINIESRTSAYCAGVYIYAQFIRKDAPTHREGRNGK